MINPRNLPRVHSPAISFPRVIQLPFHHYHYRLLTTEASSLTPTPAPIKLKLRTSKYSNQPFVSTTSTVSPPRKKLSIDSLAIRQYLNEHLTKLEKEAWNAQIHRRTGYRPHHNRHDFRNYIMKQLKKHNKFLRENPQALAQHQRKISCKEQEKEEIARYEQQKAKLHHQDQSDLSKPYSVPSAASGGVPDPTSEYLAQAALSPARLAIPRRILVILDLNGTLLHRASRKTPTKFTVRPHTHLFLSYLVTNFTVAIWSSARLPNVENMVTSLLPPRLRKQLVAIWGRNSFGLTPKDAASRVQVYKRLTRIWNDEDIQKSHPEYESGGHWDQTNTVLVDDSIEKARSEPYNLIKIPEFLGGDETGFILPQVHDYLNELSWQKDISAYVHKTPFRRDLGFTLMGYL